MSLRTKKAERADRVREFRREASRLAAMANKRIKRIEDRDLVNSPAYRRYIKDGGIRFGVKGKSHNELQAEVARMHRFLNSTTSTLRGIRKNLIEMAAITKIDYKNVQDLYSKADAFFELSSKVEQYLRVTDDIASAVGYQRIWEAVNTYVKVSEIDLADAGDKIDTMVRIIGEQLALKAAAAPIAPVIKWFIK